MRDCRNKSGGEQPSMSGPAPRWRNLLLVAGMCLAFIFGQEQIAHAQFGFSATGVMNAERQNQAATVLGTDRVLITGGATGLGAALAEIYNPLTGVFTPLANPMVEPRQSHTATRLADGRVLLIGGNTGSVATAEIFDPAGNGGAGAFTATGSMATARANFTATLLNNGTVLVAGGTSGGSGGTFNTALIFDPAAGGGVGAFAATGSMNITRQLHTATLLSNGNVLMVGGDTYPAIAGSTLTGSAEIYYTSGPSTGTFVSLAAAMSPRDSASAVLLNDNRVLIAGGSDSTGFAKTAYLFDPTGAGGAGTFTKTASDMASGHYAHTATRLLNGKVLIAGGFASFTVGATNTGELFTPAAAPGTGSFNPAGTMKKKRASHSAVLLTDGSVLLAGGTGDTDSLITAELYNPASIVATPPSFTFPDTPLNNESSPQFFTISNSNTGSTGITLNTIAISGPDKARFTLSLDSCGTLPKILASGGGNCSVSVIFEPDSSGKKSASIDINSSDPEKPTLSIPLSSATVFSVNPVTSPTRFNSQILTGTREADALISAVSSTATVGGFTFPTPTTFSVTVTGLTEGSNFIVFTAFDSVDNQVTSSVTIVLDTQAPVGGILQANPGDSQVSLNWSGFSDSGSGIGNYKLVYSLAGLPAPACVDGTAIYSGSATSFSHTGLINGASYHYLVCAVDNAGNVSAGATAAASPAAPPVQLTVAAPTGGTVTGSGIDCPGVCSELLPNGTQATLTAAASPGYQFAGWSGACAGANPVCTTAALVTSASVTAAFVDIAHPGLTLSTLPNGASTDNPTLNITGNVTDNNAIQSFTINGQPVSLDAGGSFSYALKLAAGLNNITSIATDPAGNGTTDTRTITLDATVPALTVTTPADNSTTAAQLIPVSGATEANATLVLTVNGVASPPLTLTGTGFNSVSDVALAPGVNTLVITATSAAGKTNTIKRTVTLGAPLAPSLAVIDPNQDFATDQASLTIAGAVTGTNPVTVTITQDAATFSPPVTNGLFSQDIIFTVSKTYPVIVTATDGSGNTATTVRNIIYASNGDINGDGKVTIVDALFALQMALGLPVPSPIQPIPGMNIDEALFILKTSVGLTP